MLTLSEAKSLLSAYVPNGIDFTSRLNQACARLIQAGNWRGTKDEVVFSVYPDSNGSATLTLPGRFNTILGICPLPNSSGMNCGEKALNIRNSWYEFYKGGPGYSDRQVRQWSRGAVTCPGRFTTFSTWNTVSRLKVIPEAPEDSSAQIIFKGFNNGQRIYSVIDGLWQEGVALNISGGSLNSGIFNVPIPEGQFYFDVDVTAAGFSGKPQNILGGVIKPSNDSDNIGYLDAYATSSTSVRVYLTGIPGSGYTLTLFAQQTNASQPISPFMFSGACTVGQDYVDVDVTGADFGAPPPNLWGGITTPSGSSDNIRVLSCYPTSETSVRVFLSSPPAVTGCTVSLFAQSASEGGITTQFFDEPPYSVVKPVTNGRLFLYSVDGSDNQTLVAIYDPNEQGISWPRYKVPACDQWTEQAPGRFVAVVKRAFVPLSFDYDEVIPSNVGALTYALMALTKEDNQDFARANALWYGDIRSKTVGAFQLLEQQVEDDIGPSAEGIVQVEDSFSVGRMSIGV